MVMHSMHGTSRSPVGARRRAGIPRHRPGVRCDAVDSARSAVNPGRKVCSAGPGATTPERGVVASDGDFGVVGFDRLLEDTRRSLAQLRAPAPGTDAGPAAPATGTGAAADGQIEATVQSGGRLESLRMDPRALRMGSQALSEQIVLAVNAALDDLHAKAPDPTPQAVDVDTAALADRIEELQGQAVRQMSMFAQGITDALARIERATGSRR